MATDKCSVFYSWASDHPNSTNRTLIEKALEGAAKTIRSDESIKIDPVIDRDTQGVPGSPDIASTIFAKIDRAQVFVCDITIVDETQKRPSPNPNVLIELGYALKALGPERIIMVMNTAFGKPELLPFDLGQRRASTYSKLKEVDDRGEARKGLESTLTKALRIILTGLDRPLPGQVIEPRTLAQTAQEAIETRKPDQHERVRQYMAWLGEQVAALTPKRIDADQGHWDEQLVEAASASLDSAIEFTHLAQIVVTNNAVDGMRALYDGFAHILELYQNPPGFHGPYQESDFDLPRFLGHELFVTFCALLIRSARWEQLADLLARDLYVNNAKYGEPGMLPFTAVSDYVRLLQSRNAHLHLNRRLLHADLLKERHTGTGVLAAALPMDQFTTADYFLYLRGKLQTEEAPNVQAPPAWTPWSVVYLNSTPRFLLESERIRVAAPLARALGTEDVDQLRTRFIERTEGLGAFFRDPFWRDPIEGFSPQKIGTR